jgi:hypothetical protein
VYDMLGALVDDMGRTVGNKEDAFARLDIFRKLSEEVMKPLRKGCGTMTQMAFIIRVLHIKTYKCMTNRTFNMLVHLLNLALPGMDFLKSYADSKRALSNLGLGYQTIHVCKYDCILYWGDYANSTHCLHCGTSRWRHVDGKKKVPHKILRYFPIIPQLRRLFSSREISEHSRWHMEKRFQEANVMRHPTDGDAWKDFDGKHGDFAEDARNLRLEFATDGFNPFGHMSSAYSMWPVFIIP